MAGAQTSITLTDRLTGPLTRMMRAMDRTISIMERMDRTANNVDTKGLQRARRDIQNATADLERLRSSTNSLGGSNGLNQLQNQFLNLPGPIGSAAGAVRSFFVGFAGAAAAILSLQALREGFQDFVKAADAYTSTSARLANINDGLQTQAELQENVYNAAQRSLTLYNDMAGSVAKLNLLAADAFSSNNEAIRFSELMGKAFSVSGASTQERSAGMYQLTQAMAAGKLQGDEFRSIMENAPLLAKAISKSMGVSMGALREFSRDGLITADIIKNALFEAAEDIESKFNSMPLTFADAMTVFRNWAGRAFEPLFIRFNQFVNSDAFDTLAGHAMWFINTFTAGMGLLFDTLEWLYGIIGAIGQFFVDNWSWIAPILTVVGAALGTIGLILLGLAVKWAIVTVATAIATAAQWAFNTAMAAFPGTWILLIFVAVIALVIYALINWADQTAAVVGSIVGAFYWLGAVAYNVLMGMGNIGLSVAEWFVNIWNTGVYSVQLAFYNMQMMALKAMEAVGNGMTGIVNSALGGISSLVNTAISGLNKLIDLANKIPDVNIAHLGTVDFKVKNNVSSYVGDLRSKLEEPTKKDPVNFERLDYKETGAAFDKGYNAGSKFSKNISGSLTNVSDSISNLLNGPANINNNPFSSTPGGQVSNSPGANKDAANPTGGKLDKVGKIDDEISISDEDLKLLRELAEIKSIQNFVTLTPTVNMQTGDIRNEVDVGMIVSSIEDRMIKEVARSAEGVYS
ncbi:tape measure protein [Cytobacillus praedii]|uniref:Phage tail tape measure protein n=1 Tax=Cytobacillus praedii TaxID=1742358 RepID=A0A4R1ANR5_9BACI|nr:tape measure protein [Cytobacillus praedii]TCJ01490.1 phage tail tape measure protein [Cytobacillus praedii]